MTRRRNVRLISELYEQLQQRTVTDPLYDDTRVLMLKAAHIEHEATTDSKDKSRLYDIIQDYQVQQWPEVCLDASIDTLNLPREVSDALKRRRIAHLGSLINVRPADLAGIGVGRPAIYQRILPRLQRQGLRIGMYVPYTPPSAKHENRAQELDVGLSRKVFDNTTLSRVKRFAYTLADLVGPSAQELERSGLDTANISRVSTVLKDRGFVLGQYVRYRPSDKPRRETWTPLDMSILEFTRSPTLAEAFLETMDVENIRHLVMSYPIAVLDVKGMGKKRVREMMKDLSQYKLTFTMDERSVEDWADKHLTLREHC